MKSGNHPELIGREVFYVGTYLKRGIVQLQNEYGVVVTVRGGEPQDWAKCMVETTKAAALAECESNRYYWDLQAERLEAEVEADEEFAQDIQHQRAERIETAYQRDLEKMQV